MWQADSRYSTMHSYASDLWIGPQRGLTMIGLARGNPGGGDAVNTGTVDERRVSVPLYRVLFAWTRGWG